MDGHDQMSSEVSSGVAELMETDRTAELLIWMWESLFNRSKAPSGNSAVTAGLTEVAVLGGGCFWCLDGVYRQVRGVLEVTCGYAGADAGAEGERPSYHQVCSGSTGHAECVRLVYDPAVISYSQILDIFFSAHDASTAGVEGNDVGSQYRSLILSTSEAQAAAAAEALARLRASGARPLTQVQALDAQRNPFWEAEPEHQDFFARFPGNGYCRTQVAPKITAARGTYPQLFSSGVDDAL